MLILRYFLSLFRANDGKVQGLPGRLPFDVVLTLSHSLTVRPALHSSRDGDIGAADSFTYSQEWNLENVRRDHDEIMLLVTDQLYKKEILTSRKLK